MRFGTGKKENGGFTLVEMLAVTAILMILFAVGAVQVVRNSRFLKITELDNMAREIYLAAENRAMLLAKNGTLEEAVRKAAVKEAGAPVELGTLADPSKLHYIKYSFGDAIPKDLLPNGVMDSALLTGSFYVVYEVSTGSVTDVFYAEKTADLDEAITGYFAGASDFRAFYGQWKAASADDIGSAKRVEKKAKIGYYGGAPANPAPDIPELEVLPAPVIEIINGDELVLKVTYEDEDPAAGVSRTLKTTLTYGGCTVELPTVSVGIEIGKKVCIWMLDTLDVPTISVDNKKQFKDWFEGATNKPAYFGGNFTVNAILERDGAIGTPAAPKNENSLFGTASGDGEKAYLYNLRHLQNLDTAFSKAGGKKEAYQMADIDAGELKGYNAAGAFETLTDPAGNPKSYEFKPIFHGTEEDNQITLYRVYRETTGGEYFKIENLKIKDMKKIFYEEENAFGVLVRKERPAAGLFAQMRDGTFENVRLFGAEVTYTEEPAGFGESHIGSLLGNGGHVTFINCQVGKAGTDGAVKITGVKLAGGLAGSVYENSKFEDCTIENLTVEGDKQSGGLVGDGGDTSFTNCKVGAAGAVSIKSKDLAGGLAGVTWKKNTGTTVSGCDVDKLTVVSTSIGSSGNINSAGGLIGASGDETKFINCNLKQVAVNSEQIAGGLVGNTWRNPAETANNTFENCTVVEDLRVTSNTAAAGGLMGAGENAVFTDCTVQKVGRIAVIGGTQSGGLLGRGGNIRFQNCEVGRDVSGKTGEITVSSNDLTGGLAGYGWNNVWFETCRVGNLTVTSTNRAAGGLLGYEYGEGAGISVAFTDCKVGGLGPVKVNAVTSAGGLVGWQDSKVVAAMVSRCDVENLEVTSGGHAGGMVGYASKTEYTDCKIIGKAEESGKVKIKGEYNVGGMAGYATETAKFTNCSIINANVESGGRGGGLLGAGANISFSNCAVDAADVSASWGMAGGLLGEAATTVGFTNDCKVGENGKVTVKGYDVAGGMAGTATTVTDFINCFVVNATVDSTTQVAGGMIGKAGEVKEPGFKNCTIGQVTVTADKQAGGMVGVVTTTTITQFYDCSVSNATVKSTTQNAGGLAGAATNDVYFAGCSVIKATVKSDAQNAGGLLGTATTIGFTSCKVGEGGQVTVQGSINAGGIAGKAGTATTFDDCSVSNTKVTSSNQAAGGMVGAAANANFTKNCMVGGNGDVTVTGNTMAGGMAGSVTNTVNFTDCLVFRATVTSTSNAAGGLLGVATDTANFTKCSVSSATTVTSANDAAGGLLGTAAKADFKENCKVGGDGTITVTGKLQTGGMAGKVTTVTGFDSCFVVNAGVESKNNAAGGLIGEAGTVKDAGFKNCKVGEGGKVTVKGSTQAGGMAGIAGIAGITTTVTKFDNCSVFNTGVTSTSTTTTQAIGTGGLAGKTQGTAILTSCKAVNTNVAGGNTSRAGGLVGEAAKVEFTGCQVFLDGAYLTNLKNSMQTASNLTYQITGGDAAGGLVGWLTNGSTITNSFAATLVTAAKDTGGLVGNINGNVLVTIKTSYADCYLKGEHVGGLVGMDRGVAAVTLENVYAAGFVTGATAESGGLCGGWIDNNTVMKNVYAVMHYDQGISTTIHPLMNATDGKANRAQCYYLKNSKINMSGWYPSSEGKTYTGMISLNLVDTEFEKKTSADSHSYKLGAYADKGNNVSYPFYGLKGLPHYGDWIAQASSAYSLEGQ